MISKISITEVPRVQRFAIRPFLDSLFPSGQTKPMRNRAIARAHLQYGYSLQEIAAYVGLHYSTVSRIVQRERKKSKNKT